MTNQDRAFVPPAAATQIEERALDWILREDRGDWTQHDKAELDAWLAEAWAHRIAYWRFDAAWNRAGRLNAMRPREPGSQSIVAGYPKKMLVAIVAGVAALAIFGAVATFRSISTERVYATGIGGHRTLALDDGTHIELNTDTSISVATSSSRRNVRIDRGEAYFDITHDAVHPFTVIAGDGRILDLGTKFSVRRDANRVQVALFEGRARFSVDGKDSHTGSLLLTPGDVAVATPISVSVVRRSLPALDSNLAWRRGLLVFDNTPLADVAVEFNRYNREQLVLVGRDSENVTVGGTFTARDVAAFARVAKNVLGLRVEDRGNTILVSR